MKASNVSSCESMNSLMDEMDIYRTVSPTMSQLSIPTSPHSGMVSIVEQEMMASAGNPLEEKETTIVRDSEITKDDVKSFAEPQLKERDSHIVLEPIPNPPENIQLFDKKSLIPKIVFQGTTNQEIISDQKVMKNKLLADLIEKVPKIPAVDEI
uniref:Protein TALPID3 n=1 Tax=Rhabditophanes sp. KR3021 TaxID=114890 RepID=A0AC35U1X5_9BILA